MTRINLTEKEFQSQVVTLARILGWLVYHPYDSRRSEPGFPDLTMVRAGRLIFAELKSETGKVTLAQKDWANELALSDAEYYLWRPADWNMLKRILT